MATIAEDLDICQRYLRDRAGGIWPRSELLRWYNDGLRRLLAESQGVRRLTVLDIPPKHTASISYRWERRHVHGGTSRQYTFNSQTSARQVTTLWEAEQAGAIATPQASYPCVTQLWELAYIHNSTDHDYRFALPKDHDRIKDIWFDHKPLTPVPTAALDTLETAWNRSAGEPWVWLPGFGESQSFEVYHISTTPVDDYAYQGGLYGMTRRLAGARTYTHQGSAATIGWAYTTQADILHRQQDRIPYFYGMGLRITDDPSLGPLPGGTMQCTYIWERERHQGLTTFTASGTIGTAAWEARHGASNVDNFPLGTLRRANSPERQYLLSADWESALGIIRRWHSSEGQLLIHESVLPDTPDCTESDVPDIIPAPLQKYVRYYVLFCAFARQGEGFRPDMAAHYQMRWGRGPQLLRQLADLTFADQQHGRQARPSAPENRLIRRAPYPPEYGQVGVG